MDYQNKLYLIMELHSPVRNLRALFSRMGSNTYSHVHLHTTIGSLRRQSRLLNPKSASYSDPLQGEFLHFCSSIISLCTPCWWGGRILIWSCYTQTLHIKPQQEEMASLQAPRNLNISAEYARNYHGPERWVKPTVTAYHMSLKQNLVPSFVSIDQLHK